MESFTHYKHCTEDLEWNESYYFVFYNKEHNLGGMTRLGFKPNKKEGMTFLFLLKRTRQPEYCAGPPEGKQRRGHVP